MKISYQPIEWLGDRVRILDQTRLPTEEVYIETADYQVVAEAIRTLRVRGAPAIGVAGAYGIAVGALAIDAATPDQFQEKLGELTEVLRETRPTAVNLPWALGRMSAAATGETVADIRAALVNEAVSIHAEEAAATEKLSGIGAALIEDGFRVLTHCNTGPLATTGRGTALGVILYAAEQGKRVSVLADETRPLLQGARLTCWELGKAGIPVTLITDSMAGYFMSKGEVDCVIVGADRIAANGDTANKIGTYSLSVLARENGVPFYVAAPVSTIDPSLASGEDIPIEERSREEVTGFREVRTAPEGCRAANPAFDMTPHRYITAIITERGMIRGPFGRGIG